MFKSVAYNLPNAFALILLFIVFSLAGSTAAANTIERMVMPGPVIEGHAKYENECSRCHRLFSKTAQKGLCLGVSQESLGRREEEGRIPWKGPEDKGYRMPPLPYRPQGTRSGRR